MLDASVFRALYKPSIKKFIESKSIIVEDKAPEYSLDTSSKSFLLDLLNELKSHGFISVGDLEKFLVDELNYGRAKNMYIEFIDDIELSTIDEFIDRINLLEIKGYKNASEVEGKYYVKDIAKFIELGEKRLIFSEIDSSGNSVECIRLLLAEGISLKESLRSNNYYSIEINIKLNIIAIRIINWGDQALVKYAPDNKHKEIFSMIRQIFAIQSHAKLKDTQKLVYNLVDDLTGRVLNSTITYVDNLVKEDIMSSVEEWGNKILDHGRKLEKSDKEVITQLMLNNYYRVKMALDFKRLTPSILKNKFDVQAYPRQVKFFDDTIGEGKARSSDPMESVLDTSVFYDIKARLDKEKNIKNSIIYWLGCEDEKHFGTAIHVDNQDRFKIVFYPKYFNKGKCDYVLQQIKGYY
ncbi:hypothetical protein [Clostridium thailandense]|uniref:hypothetical protein n=1 Tax=Clostridium thailandense TaxID=2794346 RepID=UPI0039893FCA